MRENLTVTWIGTGTCVPRLDRRGPCTLVRGGGVAAAVDLGLGALHGLLGEGIRHADVDAVLLTHLHPDHVTELAPFLFAANYDEEPREKPLELVGGPGVAAFVAALAAAHGRWLEPKRYELRLHELRPGEELYLGELRCRTGAVRHIASSLAFRLELGGRSLVLSGDTGPSPELEEFARDADVLVLEASLPPAATMAEHLTARQAGELARAAGAGRLVLNHVYPSADRADAQRLAEAAFLASVWVARDGLRMEL
ncbi:MAG: MBL fold metallo-hydrolase [Deltaproteobacteria bacterium]|nr:MBL fold metallo-hydrolase [Deltaproteobacteria bacterium]